MPQAYAYQCIIDLHNDEKVLTLLEFLGFDFLLQNCNHFKSSQFLNANFLRTK